MSACTLIKEVVKIHRFFDGGSELFIGVDNADELFVSVVVNDVFAWGCADMEDVTEDNIALFKSCADEIRAVQRSGLDPFQALCVLFACRVRQQKPFKYDGVYPVDFEYQELIGNLPYEDHHGNS